MSGDLIERAHRAYDQEVDHLERLLASDPTYSGLHHRLERAEAVLTQGRDPDQARAVREARTLLLKITRETAFKMGFMLAHIGPDEPGE